MNPITEPIYCFNPADQKFYKQPPMQVLTDTAGILRRLVATQPTVVPDMLEMSDGTKVSACFTANNQVVLSWPVRQLTLTTTYTLLDAQTSGSIRLAPSFGRGEDGVRLSPTFTIPDSVRLRFGSTFTFSSPYGWTWNQAHLACEPQGVAGSWLLPLPNVYNDGRVCMGNSFLPDAGSLMEVAVKTWEHFTSSAWNADLLDTRLPKARKLFQVKMVGDDPVGEALPLPTGDLLTGNLVAFANPVIAHMFAV